jgi:hypothetical protein
MILTDYSEKLERVLADIRMVVNQVTDLLRQPERQDLVASSSKGLPTLSKLSFPDNFSELPTMEALAGVEVTPMSRIVRGSKDVRKNKSPEKKIRDEVMTSVSKGESGSEREEVPCSVKKYSKTNLGKLFKWRFFKKERSLSLSLCNLRSYVS